VKTGKVWEWGGLENPPFFFLWKTDRIYQLQKTGKTEELVESANLEILENW